MKKRIERTYMTVILIGHNGGIDAQKEAANHERFNKKPFMVDNVTRIDREWHSRFSVHTFIEVYDIDNIFSFKYLRHLFCKLRATALRYMGIGEIVVVVKKY